MFDLEQAISVWRRQLAAGGIKSPAVLDELESHLREDMDRQSRAGFSEQNTFAAAVRRIGRARVLRDEFARAGVTTERRIMKRIIMIVAGVVGVLVGMAFVMPAVALYRHEGTIAGGDVALLLLGTALALGGAGTAVFGAKKRAA